MFRFPYDLGVRTALRSVVAAGLLITGTVAAKDVTIALQVSSRGLNVRQAEGARALYARIQRATRWVCSGGLQVALEPINEARCREKALADAVRSFNLPLLTGVYMEAHSPPILSDVSDAPIQAVTK